MNKISITYLLIGISFLSTLSLTFFPDLIIFGLNRSFLNQGEYGIYTLQLFLSVFLHGGLMHFFMNSIFLYFFGYPLELLIGKKKFVLFFLFITLFNGILLTFFDGEVNTIGISGFCMAILSYYVLELKSRNNNEYKGGITAIILNIIIGFFPGISLYGHLFGVIGGVIFYFLNKDFFTPKLVGKVLETRRKSIVSEN